MIYVELFLTFLLIGSVSFGGGYAMIPLMQQEVVNRHAWMTVKEFSDVIAVAGMSPGPIGTNSSIFIGYDQAGLLGAIISTAGMVLPSLMIILGLGVVFARVQHHVIVRSVFYGLRPIITGLIIYAAYVFAMNSGMLTSVFAESMGLIAIYVASLCALIFLHIHPVYVILVSGLIGIAVYS